MIVGGGGGLPNETNVGAARGGTHQKITPNLGPLVSRWEINKFNNC
jgi:hypothetical protein